MNTPKRAELSGDRMPDYQIVYVHGHAYFWDEYQVLHWQTDKKGRIGWHTIGRMCLNSDEAATIARKHAEANKFKLDPAYKLKPYHSKDGLQ
jgi:hypothetical protein